MVLRYDIFIFNSYCEVCNTFKEGREWKTMELSNTFKKWEKGDQFRAREDLSEKGYKAKIPVFSYCGVCKQTYHRNVIIENNKVVGLV